MPYIRPNHLFYWCLFVVLTLCLCVGQATELPRIVPMVPDVLIFHGVRMVPLEPLAELIGAEEAVSLAEKPGEVLGTVKISVTRGEAVFRFTVGSDRAHSQREPLTLPLAPFRPDSSSELTFVPLDACVRALGGTLEDLAGQEKVRISLQHPDVTLILPRARRTGGRKIFMTGHCRCTSSIAMGVACAG